MPGWSLPNKIDETLALRRDLFETRNQLIEHNQILNNVQSELNQFAEQEGGLEQDYQAASDHAQLVQNALRQQEKITRYQEDLEELQVRLEEQMMVVEEAQERVVLAEEHASVSEDEVDSLKTQLADYQQALDMQQTRALQYQQAVNALDKARALLDDDSLTVDSAMSRVAELKKQQDEQTQTLLSVKHRLDMSSAAAEQFELAYSLLTSIKGDVPRAQANEYARVVLNEARDAKYTAAQEHQWVAQQRDLTRRAEQRII